MPPDRRTANRYPHLGRQVREIIAAYAMSTPRGVVLCFPTDDEAAAWGEDGVPQWRGNNGKICYPFLPAARRAARELNRLPGADPVTPYGCPRADHYHLVDERRRRWTEQEIIARIYVAARRAALGVDR